MARIVDDAAPAAAVVDNPGKRGRWARRAAGKRPAGHRAGRSLPDGDPPPLDGLRRRRPGLLCYTSGTTGAPEGRLAHGNLLAAPRALLVQPGAGRRSDRLVLALPLPHPRARGRLHGTLRLASTCCCPASRSTPCSTPATTERRCSSACRPCARLAGSPRAGELGQLLAVRVRVGPLPPTVFERLAERAGQRVLERYGMTETIMNVSNPMTASAAEDGQAAPARGRAAPGRGDRRRGAAAQPQRMCSRATGSSRRPAG